MQDINAKEEDMTSQGYPKKLTRSGHSSSRRKDHGQWNDSVTGSGLDNEQIFSAIKKLLCCTVCFEYRTETNQCKNGHLICRQCTRQLERGMQPEANRGACPTCRVALFPGISRCLLATQLSAELPTTCIYCNLCFRQSELEHHESDLCQLRPVRCKYNIFGCLWKGKANEAPKHERGCSVSRKSVKEVESVIQEKFKQRSKWSGNCSSSWQEIVTLFKEQPLGVFVCVREAVLYQVSRENQRNEFQFRGTTNQLSQTEQFNVTIELNLNPDELKFYYRTKFHSSFTDKMRFRLLSINSDKLVIPVADRFRLPKIGIHHECQKFYCQVNVCDNKLMNLANKFSDQAIDGGSDFSVKMKFLMIFESFYTVRMPCGDFEEWNAVIPGSPTDSQTNEDTVETNIQTESIEHNNNINHARVVDNVVEIMPPPSVLNNNRDLSGHTWNSINDDVDMPSEVNDEFRAFADELVEGIAVEENPLLLTIRNNSALEEFDAEAFSAQNLIRSRKLAPVDEAEATARILRSRPRITPRKRGRPKGTKKFCTDHPKGMVLFIDMLTPYLTRGHLWQNYELMNKNSSRVLRRRGVVRKSKSRSSFLTASQLKDCVAPLLAPITEGWNIVKRTSSELIEIGQDILKSLSPFKECTDVLIQELSLAEELRDSSVNLIEHPHAEDDKLSISAGDTPDKSE